MFLLIEVRVTQFVSLWIIRGFNADNLADFITGKDLVSGELIGNLSNLADRSNAEGSVKNMTDCPCVRAVLVKNFRLNSSVIVDAKGSTVLFW